MAAMGLEMGIGIGIGAGPELVRDLGWAEFAREVVDLYAPPIRARRTQGSIRLALGRLQSLGQVQSTAGLTPAAIGRFVQGLAAQGLGRITIHGQLGYARAICQYAEAAGYLGRSPFSIRKRWVRQGRPDPGRVRHLSLAEVRRLLDALAGGRDSWEGHRLWAVASVVAYCGLRRDEALTLRRQDVDLHARVLAIQDPDPLWRPLKTEGAAVPVPIPPELAQVLASWLPRTGSDWLFPGKRLKGPWVGGSAGSRALDQLQRVAGSIGLNGVTWLALRHAWATHGESAWGLTAPQIQRVLRHSTPRTQAHYRHADQANLQAIADRVSYFAEA